MLELRYRPFVLITALSISSPIVAATDLYGPLRAYAQSPLQSVSHANQLRSGFSLPTEFIEAYGSATIASVWAHTDEYAFDYYHNMLELGGKWQINHRWQWELNYRWVFAADNHLDGFTQTFHDLFGIDQNGRDEVDKHRFYIAMPQYNVLEEDFEGHTIANNVSTYLQYQILQSKHHGLSIGASLYYNDVAHGTFKGNSFEQGLQLNYSYLYDAHAIYSMIGMTFRSNDTALSNIPYNQNTLAVAGGYRYTLAEKHHLLIELHWYQGSDEGPEELSDEGANEIVLGYRYLMGSSAIEVLATENVRNMDNSTDIAFTFGYRYFFTPDSGD